MLRVSCLLACMFVAVVSTGCEDRSYRQVLELADRDDPQSIERIWPVTKNSSPHLAIMYRLDEASATVLVPFEKIRWITNDVRTFLLVPNTGEYRSTISEKDVPEYRDIQYLLECRVVAYIVVRLPQVEIDALLEKTGAQHSLPENPSS